MKVLVTGGTGFIGSHSVAVLLSQGHQVRLLVRSRTRLHHPVEVLSLEAAGPVKALMTRGMLLGIKHRVEAQRKPEPQLPNGSRVG